MPLDLEQQTAAAESILSKGKDLAERLKSFSEREFLAWIFTAFLTVMILNTEASEELKAWSFVVMGVVSSVFIGSMAYKSRGKDDAISNIVSGGNGSAPPSA
jgi:hypothetical protein